MNQPYFIVVLAHSFHGRLRSLRVPYQALYVVLALAAFGSVSLFAFVSSYVRMSMKVAGYNNLWEEVQTLRERFHSLEYQSEQTEQQLASLQLLAAEVSVAYGLERRVQSAAGLDEASLTPSVSQSVEQYKFLRNANYVRTRQSRQLFPSEMLPSIWPVDGRLQSSFGSRTDPFSGDGAFHSGVDISASSGTDVKTAADGLVLKADWGGQYGNLVIVDHGNDIRTYYAHLSRFSVVAGQWVRRGEIVGRVGSTGRSTSAHLHYEVRRNGIPINPYPYLKKFYAITEPIQLGL